MDALWGLAPWWGTRGSRKSGDCNAIQRRQGDLVPPPARYSGWNCNHRSASLLWEIKRHTQSEMNSLSHSGRICCRFHADKLEQLELDFGILGATRPGTRHSALDFALARRLADALVGHSNIGIARLLLRPPLAIAHAVAPLSSQAISHLGRALQCSRTTSS